MIYSFLLKMYSYENLFTMRGDLNMLESAFIKEEYFYKKLKNENTLFNITTNENIKKFSSNFTELIKQIMYKDQINKLIDLFYYK